MSFKRHLLPIFLFLLPLGIFAQGTTLKKLHDKYESIRLRYFYESVIRAGANVAMGEEGVELTKGIQKVITTDFKHSVENEGALDDLRLWLRQDKYETYIEITNRGNLAGMASFFMNMVGQNGEEDSDTDEAQLEESIQEMSIYGLDNGKTIASLVVVMKGEKGVQVYELDGKLELESIPKLIERVQKFTEILE